MSLGCGRLVSGPIRFSDSFQVGSTEEPEENRQALPVHLRGDPRRSSPLVKGTCYEDRNYHAHGACGKCRRRFPLGFWRRYPGQVVGPPAERLRRLVQRGLELAIGSQDDADYLTEATQDVDALFWVTPPGYGSDDVRAFQNRLGKAGGNRGARQPDSAGSQSVVAWGPVRFGRGGSTAYTTCVPAG